MVETSATIRTSFTRRTLSALLIVFFCIEPGYAQDKADLYKEAEQIYSTRNRSGNAERAIALYAKIIKNNPEDDIALWKLSRSYRWRGDQLTQKKERLLAYQIAEDYANQAIAINSKSVGGHLMLGIAYGRKGETQGVLKSLFLISPIKKEMSTVLALDPENDIARHILAVLYRKVPGWMGGSIEQSIDLLKEAIKINPNRTMHHLELAQSYLKHKQHQEAIEALKRMFEIKEPTDKVSANIDERVADALLRRLTIIYQE